MFVVLLVIDPSSQELGPPTNPARFIRFTTTPLYDVLSVDPSLAAHQINQKQVRLAMAVGDKRRYRITEIAHRHFVHSAIRAEYDAREMLAIFDEFRREGEAALERAVAAMPTGTSDAVTGPIGDAFRTRLRKIDLL
ncbi:hypothetical protein [uncultured Sphingomonas sp.]|uniref:hypothetical protein n=1 Tax=uncultured Sphingomonas sp. TaxID=158754 RepID=UPI0025DBA38C|nr:hypothetical protein [uncultured Sphingomonas sp.]